MSGKAKPYIVQGLIALIVLGIGLYAGMYFMDDKETAKRGKRVDSGILVEVESVERAEHALVLEASGVVEPSRSMHLKSEAHGRVTYVSRQFYPGAHLKKGAVIAKISTEDYQLKLMQAKIALSQREAALVLEEAKGRAAEAELRAMQKTILDGVELTEEQSALIRRAPQLQDAMSNVEMAKIALKQAQIDYDRSVIRMPYDGVVGEVTVSQGDYISGAASLGTVTATDEVRVRVSVQPSLLAWIGGDPSEMTAIGAKVTYDMGGEKVTRNARILSMLGEVESLGRMVQLILSVEAPYGDPADRPLLIGTFVHVAIEAPNKLDSIRLPRAMVREGSHVFVCNDEYRLEIRKIETPYKSDDYVYVTSGLEDGERVVTTLISSPVDGRKLRVRGENDKKPNPREKK